MRGSHFFTILFCISNHTRIEREAMNDVFWFVPHVVSRFTVPWMQNGILHHTHNHAHAVEAELTARHSSSPRESDWCVAIWACAEWWFSTFSKC